MIKITLPAKPIELTDEVEKQLIAEFVADKNKSVWRKDYIKRPLEEMTNEKCSYCETKLTKQGLSFTLDHYHDKDIYPDEVVSWGNLLPSCTNCNSHKGKTDTYKNPILNPTEQDPKEYLYLKDFRIKSKDNDYKSIGKFTVDLLDLNNRKKLLDPRLDIAYEMINKIRYITDKISNCEDLSELSQIIINRVRLHFIGLLNLAQPHEEYSAFIATILLNDDDYTEAVDKAKQLELWTEEMELLHESAALIKLDMSK